MIIIGHIVMLLYQMHNKNLGGARKGSGRKKLDDSVKSKSRTISLSDADWAIFKLKGATKWLRKILNNQ